MKQIAGESIIGKTIKNIEYTFDNEMIIIFTDGTFTIFWTATGYEDSTYICNDVLDLALLDDLHTLIKISVITEKEADTIKNDIKVHNIQMEIKEYERLKIKYEK